MKHSIKNRLGQLEKVMNIDQGRLSAVVICDPDLFTNFDTSLIQAEYIIILPDNGRGEYSGQNIPKGSYSIC